MVNKPTADDRIIPITAEEAAKLKSVDDLVDHNIIGRRDGWDRANFGRNWLLCR